MSTHFIAESRFLVTIALAFSMRSAPRLPAAVPSMYMLFRSRCFHTERTPALVELVLVCVLQLLLSRVVALALLSLLNRLKFRFVSDKRSREPSEDARLESLGEVRVDHGSNSLDEIEGIGDPKSVIALLRSVSDIIV